MLYLQFDDPVILIWIVIVDLVGFHDVVRERIIT